MIPVNGFMIDALAGLLQPAPLTAEKVDFAWRHAVGPAAARATSVALTGSELIVRVESGEWHREIKRSAALIKERLDKLLGPGTIRTLKVVPPPRNTGLYSAV
jgi:hypothetical protein